MEKKNELNSVVEEKIEYCKPLSELTIDEIKAFDVYPVALIKNLNRKTGFASYSWNLVVNTVSFKDRLEENEYRLILLKKGILQEKDRIESKAYVRFVKGKTSKDKDYYSVQIVFTQSSKVVHFLSKTDYECLEEVTKVRKLKPIKWEYSSKIADDIHDEEDEVLGF